MNDFKNPNWRKEASNKQLTDTEAGLAFMKMALPKLEDRAAPLLQEPYFIGFEVVHANPNNTNMAGVFVFRVSKTFLYVPVFFKAGKIKPVIMLYNTDVHQFTLLSNEACNKLIGVLENNEPQTVRNDMKRPGNGINVEKMYRPKQASQATREAWDKMRENGSGPQELLLPELLKKNAAAANGLKTLFLTDDETVKHLFHTYEDVTSLFEPQEEVEEIKTAQARDPLLVRYDGRWNKEAQDKETQHVLEYSFDDNRKQHAEIWDCGDQEWSTIDRSGVWDVLLRGGEVKRMEVLLFPIGLKNSFDPEYDQSSVGVNTYDLSTSGFGVHAEDTACVAIRPAGSSEPFTKKRLPLQKTPNSGTGGLPAYGVWYGDIPTEALQSGNPELGQHVVFVGGPDLQVLCGGKVVDHTSFEDTHEVELDCEMESWEVEKPARTKRVIYGDGVETPVEGWFLIGKADGHWETYTSGPEETGHQKGEDKPEIHFGSEEELLAALRGEGCSRLRVRPEGDGVRLYVDGDATWKYTRKEAATRLALAGVYGPLAQSIMETTGDRERNFWIKGADLRIVGDDTPPQESRDPDWNVITGQNTSHVLRAEETEPDDGEHDPRGGDQYEEIMFSGSPDDLFQVSQSVDEPSIFDLGVVGRLVGTYNASGLIEEYYSHLVTGLDRLGRMLFLVYWKPEDFIERYGSDDVADLESQLYSAFESFGDLVFQLGQRFEYTPGEE